MRLVNWRALVVGAVGFGLAACGDDVTVTPPPPQITLNPTSLTCNTGQTTAVGVTVSGGSNTSVAFAGGTGVTVTPSGSSGATVVCGNTPGAAVITVTVTSNGQQFTSSIPVTINQAPNQANVIAIQVAPTSASLTPGGTLTIVPTVTLANGAPANTSTNVTYTSSSSAVTVTRNTANNTATVTVAANATPGTQAVITATPDANTNLHASTVVTVAATSTLITGLAVSPNTVNLNAGGTQQIVANVSLAAGAPAGTSTNVTCTSSNTNVATVTNGSAPGGTSCVVTAVNSGTATITVASVAAPTVTQLVGVNVTSPAPVRLTIQNVEVVNAAGNRVPADQTNVAGNLFLTLNLDPGDNRPDSVVVTIGGQRVNCQTFTAQFTQALRASLVSGAADVQPIACQLNTSQFNTTSGVPLVQNGKQQLSATVFFRPGTAGTGSNVTQTATIPLELTINNQSGFFVNVTNTPSAAQTAAGGPTNGQAVGPQGVTWRSGSLNITVLPVNFANNGQSGPGSPSFGPTTVALVDCPFNSVGVCNSFRLVATATTTQVTGSNSGTVTFTGDTGCFWDINLGSASAVVPAPLQGLQALFTGGGTAAGGTGSSGAFCAGLTGSGFTGDPATNTLTGYTTPNAGRTVNGATNIPATAQAATFVVVGSTTPSFGTAGTVILAANGQPITANLPANQGGGIVGGNVAAAVYIDNQAPEPVAQANFPTTNFSTSVDAASSANLVFGFFNNNQQFTSAAFQFAYVDPLTGALTSTNPDWGGVDRVSEAFFAQAFAGSSANSTTSNPTTFVGTATRVTTASQLAPLPPLGSSNFYRLAFQETDALGNRRNQFVNQVFNPGTPSNALVQTRFNVDVSAPTLQLLTAANPAGCVLDATTVGVCQQRVGPANQVFGPSAVRVGFNTVSNVAIAPQIAFQASDDVGFGPTPLSATVARYRRSGTGGSIIECLSSVDASGNPTFVDVGSGSTGSTGSQCAPVLISLAPINIPTTVSALYSGSVQARDQAGNLSTPITFSFVVDVAAPSSTAISLSLPQTLTGGQPVSFTAGATDNLAVRSGAPQVGYAGFPSPLIYPETSVLNLATILGGLSPLGTSSLPTQNQSAMTLTIPSFIRTITAINGTTFTPNPTTSVANTLQARIFDLANNSNLSAVVPIPAANVPGAPATSPYVNAANQVNNVQTFSLTVAPGTPTIPPGLTTFTATICGPVNVGSGCPGQATFSIVQQGQANTYISQFTRLELWVFDPVAGGYRFLATAPASFVTDAPGQGRLVTSNVVLPVNTQPYFLAPPATVAPITYRVLAIGVNGTGDALTSNEVQVTINP